MRPLLDGTALKLRASKIHDPAGPAKGVSKLLCPDAVRKLRKTLSWLVRDRQSGRVVEVAVKTIVTEAPGAALKARSWAGGGQGSDVLKANVPDPETRLTTRRASTSVSGV